MEPKNSLPRLQVPATCPYSEPDRSTQTHTHKLRFFWYDFWTPVQLRQQDNEMDSKAIIFMLCVDSGLGERITRRGLWPLRSSDLKLCDFYLWGMFML
jgi:hypothetical protein